AYVGIIGEALLEGLFVDGKKTLAKFIEVLQSDEIQDWARETGEKIRDMAQKIGEVISKLIDKWNELSPATQKVLKILGMLGATRAVASGAVLKFTSIIPSLISRFHAVITIFKTLGVVIGLLTSPIVLIISAVIAAAALTYAYWEPIKGCFINLW